MSDLVERLRAWHKSGETITGDVQLYLDAADEIERLQEQLEKANDVERIARAIYETEPHYESGEYVDGFAVSPGGHLSWEQALTRDAEFASDPLMGSITAFAYRAARAIVSLSDGEK